MKVDIITIFPEMVRAGAIADELGLLTFLFAITGVVALLAWQSLFPSRRDYLADCNALASSA